MSIRSQRSVCAAVCAGCAAITCMISAFSSFGGTPVTRAAQARAVAEAVSYSRAAASIDAAVDDYVEKQRVAQQIPGIALGVMRDGQIVKARGYGLANIELNVPVRPETVFQTGSVGKQFTATAVMMLVEENKVSLDAKIGTYLPGIPVTWKAITVRNLLTHTSGIGDYVSDENTKPGGLINLHADYTEEQIYQKVLTLPLNFAAGTKWEYSNSGYFLLGVLIHKVTGEFYGDFLQERIFRPLGMNSTRVISEADIVPNRAAGYELVNGAIKNQQWVAPTINTGADGSLYTNALDLAKWDAALYSEKPLKRSSFEQMWTPVRLQDGEHYPYGFGWDVDQVNGHRLLEHEGAWQGFTMSISRYVDDRLTIVVLTNLDSEHSDPGKIAHDVAAFYVPALKSVEGK
jgi:CubicO group peptidase (beta-lactamase class C family)